MNTRKYEHELAVKYAKKWALSRNPKYYNFDPIGGDCTSFVSQCLFDIVKSHMKNNEKEH